MMPVYSTWAVLGQFESPVTPELMNGSWMHWGDGLWTPVPNVSVVLLGLCPNISVIQTSYVLV